jgi:hypothetical protein
VPNERNEHGHTQLLAPQRPPPVARGRPVSTPGHVPRSIGCEHVAWAGAANGAGRASS